MHKARVTQPIRSSSRSQTGAHAYHVAASPDPEAIEGIGLIYFAEMPCSFLTSRLGKDQSAVLRKRSRIGRQRFLIAFRIFVFIQILGLWSDLLFPGLTRRFVQLEHRRVVGT